MGEEEEQRGPYSDDNITYVVMSRMLKAQYVEDPVYKPMYLWITALIEPEGDKIKRHAIKLKALRYTVHKKVLYHVGRDGKMRKCIPHARTHNLIREHHDSSFGGHFGEEITKQRIPRTFWWPSIIKDVKEYVKTCIVCQKQSRNQERNAHHRYETTEPFEMVFIDYLVNLLLTHKRNRQIIIASDGFTRWIMTKAVTRSNALEAAILTMDSIVAHYGTPLTIITD